MTVDGTTVLVSGTESNRVGEIASTLADTVAVRTSVAPDAERWQTSDVEVVVFVDGEPGARTRESLPEDAARVVVFEDPDGFEGNRPTNYDSVLVEPSIPDDLESTVASLARRVRYDRRLQECAELATRCGRAESACDGNSAGESQKLRERVDDVTAELDRLLAEFSNDDFHQAFRALAAD